MQPSASAEVRIHHWICVVTEPRKHGETQIQTSATLLLRKSAAMEDISLTAARPAGPGPDAGRRPAGAPSAIGLAWLGTNVSGRTAAKSANARRTALRGCIGVEGGHRRSAHNGAPRVQRCVATRGQPGVGQGAYNTPLSALSSNKSPSRYGRRGWRSSHGGRAAWLGGWTRRSFALFSLWRPSRSRSKPAPPPRDLTDARDGAGMDRVGADHVRRIVGRPAEAGEGRGFRPAGLRAAGGAQSRPLSGWLSNGSPCSR